MHRYFNSGVGHIQFQYHLYQNNYCKPFFFRDFCNLNSIREKYTLAKYSFPPKFELLPEPFSLILSVLLVSSDRCRVSAIEPFVSTPHRKSVQCVRNNSQSSHTAVAQVITVLVLELDCSIYSRKHEILGFGRFLSSLLFTHSRKIHTRENFGLPIVNNSSARNISGLQQYS